MHLRLHGAIKIHQRLQEEDSVDLPGTRRIVRFLGATKATYRLKRLRPGPMHVCPSDELNADKSDIFLVFCQRWALQYFSACRPIHSKGVVIASPPEDVIWLRPEFSVVVARLITASCLDLCVEAWQQGGPTMLELYPYSQAGAYSIREDELLSVEACGHFELDIVLWAV